MKKVNNFLRKVLAVLVGIFVVSVPMYAICLKEVKLTKYVVTISVPPVIDILLLLFIGLAAFLVGKVIWRLK